MTKRKSDKIRIQWVKSWIGCTEDQRATVRGLGPRRRRHVVERGDTPPVRGLGHKIRHPATGGEGVSVAERSGFAAGARAPPEGRRARGLVRRPLPVKILGDGELKVKLTVAAHAFSASAKEKIEKAGGKVEEI